MMALVLTSAAIAVGTYGFGWSCVPVIGLAVGVARITETPIRTAFTAGVLGWMVLLLLAAAGGAVGRVADVLGGVVGLPSPVVLGATVLLPGLLAGAAAGVGSAMIDLRGSD